MTPVIASTVPNPCFVSERARAGKSPRRRGAQRVHAQGGVETEMKMSGGLWHPHAGRLAIADGVHKHAVAQHGGQVARRARQVALGGRRLAVLRGDDVAEQPGGQVGLRVVDVDV